MTEALHLRKPMLALPMGGQFEQELNAHLLDDLNYGKNGRTADSESIGDFLYRLRVPVGTGELSRAGQQRDPRQTGRAVGRRLHSGQRVPRKRRSKAEPSDAE